MKKIYFFGALALLFAACKPSVNITVPPTSGNADFTNYLAIGNSLTAGYSDGCLTVSGQLNSYPKRLFDQFNQIPPKAFGAVGGGAQMPFIQPLLNGDNGFDTSVSHRKLVLQFVHNYCTPNDSSLSAVPVYPYIADPKDMIRYNWTYNTYNNGQINNIGVPGIRVADYPVANYGNPINPFFNIFAYRFYHTLTERPIDELYFRMHNFEPTFFTMWLGSNDVLGYALAGGQGNGVGTAIPVLGNFYNPADITPYSVFTAWYDSALVAALSTGAKGALINIPDIASLPYFTTIPSNGLVITRQTQADSLNRYWRSTLNLVFQLGANQFIIKDNLGNIRQSVPGELILLSTPQDSLACAGWGVTKPIPQQYVLTTDELQNIRANTYNFNQFIYTEALLHHLAYVDMNAYLQTVATGVTFNGITYNANFISGGSFSLDGVHPTQRGYAIIANKIISTINDYYSSTVALIDVNQFHGVLFP